MWKEIAGSWKWGDAIPVGLEAADQRAQAFPLQQQEGVRLPETSCSEVSDLKEQAQMHVKITLNAWLW